MWLRVFEVWLTTRLLASPVFHRAVRAVHKRVHEMRHGKNPADQNTNGPDGLEIKKFFQFYLEELRHQIRGGSSKK